jgi:vacuolar protein sorting-associated protein 11
MDHFVVFLETVACRRWGQSVESETAETATAATSKAASLVEPAVDGQHEKQDQLAVWNTLLEGPIAYHSILAKLLIVGVPQSKG